MDIKNSDHICLRPLKALGDDINKMLSAFGYDNLEIHEVWMKIQDREALFGYYILKNDYLMSTVTTVNTIDWRRSSGIFGADIPKSVGNALFANNNSSVSIFDDIEDDILLDTDQKLSDVNLWTANQEKYTLPQRLIDENNPVHIKKLSAKEIYEAITSAKFHKAVTYLNALPDAWHGSVTYVRMSELGQLLNINIPSGGMENFAVDCGSSIIYFHMDSSRGGYEDVKLNKYRYNDPLSGEIIIFDNKRGGKIESYDEWSANLDGKTILVFGYERDKFIKSNLCLYDTEPPLVFLGEFMAVNRNQEGVGLSIADYSYKLPI